MLNIFAHIVTSFVGTVAFSIIFNVPYKYYIWCGLTGMSGWLVYCIIYTENSVAIATFFAAVVVVLMSRVLAVYQRCPITIFLVAGIFPLIPGASVYYTAYYLVIGELSNAAHRGMLAVNIALAIVLAIVFAISIPKHWFNIKSIKLWK